jgi:acetyl esterase/lipase
MNNHTSTSAEANLYAVEITRDIRFGEGSVGYGTATPGTRPLLLDMYAPVGAARAQGRPALVMSHGGAYHRGAKDKDEFEQDGTPNTPVTEYCQRFAQRGWVCFSVGYRLTQERAAPQPAPIRRQRGGVNRGRIDYVRSLLGLPPASDEELLFGVEGAIADVAAAFNFVHGQAASLGIDPACIAMGGFSAGAFSSIYAAYALGVPAAALVSLSGGMEADDAAYYVRKPSAGEPPLPPVLMFSSEFDLPGIHERTMALATQAQQAGVGLRRYFVPGKPHFYDRQTEVLLQANTLPGGAERCTIDDAIASFLAQTVGHAGG